MRKRSKYRPKCAPGQLPVTIRHAGDVPLQLVPHQCLVDFDNETCWHTIASRLNWGWVASERFNEARPEINASIEVLKGLKGRYDITADERATIGRGLTICDEMQGQMTRREMRDDLRTMFKRNREILNDEK